MRKNFTISISFKVIIILLLFLLPNAFLKAQYSEEEIKIGLILRFIEHTKFPSDAFKSPKEMIQIGILGDDPFGDKLEAILAHYKIDGRGLRVRRKKTASELWGCQVVVISQSEQDKLDDILDYFRRYPTLTIGNNLNDFIERCGIINFITVDGVPFRFEMNIEAAQNSNLVLDVGLYRMARRIESCK